MSATATGTTRSHDRALAMAQRSAEVRQKRSELKERLAAGHLHLAQLLADPPPYAERMNLIDALLALPRIYKRKAERALIASASSERAPLGSLTERQRAALLHHFKTQHPSIWALWAVMARRLEE